MNRLFKSVSAGAFIKTMAFRNCSALNNFTFTTKKFVPIYLNHLNRNFSSEAAAVASASKVNRVKREKPAPITLTENAIKRIKELTVSNPDHIGIKIGVRRRGCNGYSYTMNYATNEDLNSNFEVVKAEDLFVLVDPKAIFYIVGTVMDFEETELSTQFTFNNPNVKGECGCKESFTV